MIVYHGTTVRRARRICQEGFRPRKPSRRVWFAVNRAYALGRAKTQARRAHGRPIVLMCDLDTTRLRQRLGHKRVAHKNNVIAVDAAVPVTVLRSNPTVEVPTSPDELAQWVNSILRLKPYKGVGRRHPGIERLSRWVNSRLSSGSNTKVAPRELLDVARRWLPEQFERFEIDMARLHAYPRVGTIRVRADEAAVTQADAREDQALNCLADPKPEHRIRGLALLAEMRGQDLFDWCVMFLADDAPAVQVAALKTMLGCDDGHPGPIEPLARSESKRIRAAAIAALTKHAGNDAPKWYERGLKDPCACVRLETARRLPQLDPSAHRSIFELALYDPNPEVARIAHRLTRGKGFPMLTR